jgi:uncharacterized protein
MVLDWNAFTPGPALMGGVLIGLAAALLVLGVGRVAGVAGIVGGALQGLLEGRLPSADAVRWAFISGLLLAPWAWRWFAPLPPAASSADAGSLIAAGLLVGFGVRLGNGCTSGHGVCGLARGSMRSLANVMVFMGAGVVTVAAMRHLGT